MSGPQLLSENVGKLKSRMGAFLPGERVVFRGHDLHVDLKDMDWLELYIFGITGRRFTAEQLRLMNAIWVYTSYPDARIWNNRIAALAGAARSTGNLAVAGAIAVSEAHIYGRGPDLQAIDFFLRTVKEMTCGEELAKCVQREISAYGRLAGYGRPVINEDERIAPTMALANRLGLGGGPHVSLAFTVERFLLDGGRDLRMNYGALAAALGADLGLSSREYYMFMIPAFLAGMPPCYLESAERPEGTLFPLPCANVLYEGPSKRPWPGNGQGQTETR